MSHIQNDVIEGPGFLIGRSVSLDHAARLLGVTRRTIYNRIRDGRLRTIRTIGGSQRVLIASVVRTSQPMDPATGRLATLSVLPR